MQASTLAWPSQSVQQVCQLDVNRSDVIVSACEGVHLRFNVYSQVQIFGAACSGSMNRDSFFHSVRLHELPVPVSFARNPR